MRGLGALLAAALIAGCDPAVDGTYEGEARFEVNGLVCAIGSTDSTTTAVGIAWTTLAPDATRLDTVGGEANFVDASAMPASFRMPLYGRPPAGATSRIRTVDGLFDVAIGIPVLFEDYDDDGALERDVEPVLGVGRGQFVLYTQPAVSGDDVVEVPLEAAIRPGWSAGKAICDEALGLMGLELQPPDARFDVWLYEGAVAHNPLEQLAPQTCLLPF